MKVKRNSMASKWQFLNNDISRLHNCGENHSSIARALIAQHGADYIRQKGVEPNAENLRKYVASYLSKKHISDTHPALTDECERVGIDLESVNHYWHKGKEFSIHVKNNAPTYFELRDEVVKEMQAHAPKYPKINFKQREDGCLLVISPADIHIGKLGSAFETGDEYNAEIAIQRVKEGISGLIDKAKGVKIDQILFLAGNDILHTDTPRSTTTSGTFQDSHLMWYDAFRVAKKLMVEIIEMLMPIAPIQVDYNPSNHDFMTGFFLIDTVSSWFTNADSVTFNADMKHRKYFRYHKNLICSTHGDGAKEKDLPLLMAHEASNYWHDCPHRYILGHHLHHKTSKDHLSVTFETLRSPSGTDSWHHRNGYQHAPKAIEGFVHDKEYGQIMRLTHLFT